MLATILFAPKHFVVINHRQSKGIYMAAAVTYPKISKSMWWALRSRLNKSIPTVISPTFISSIKPMSDASARSNVINPLRELGLIDEDYKPTELAKRWRHDDDYPNVCHEIRQRIYPSELIDSFPSGDPEDKEGIRKWFMKVGHVGEAAARMYSETYILLSQADVNSVNDDMPKTATRSASSNSKPQSKTKSAPKPEAIKQPDVPASGPEKHTRRLPAVHIDVQVHISPDTAPEQIDRIFESMAKHLGNFIG
jgi:hypothetical protein